MKIVLNRDDIEEAIEKYIKEKYLPYGDTRKLSIVQGTKASAVITFIQPNALPGLEDTKMPDLTDGVAVDKVGPQRNDPVEA